MRNRKQTAAKEIAAHITHEIVELLKVRSIISFTIIYGLLWGFMTDRIGSEIFVPFATMVIGYFFNRRQPPDYEWRERREDREK